MAKGFPEVEEQEGTRIEKVLLVALVAFLLVGSFWALERIESIFPSPVLQGYSDPNDTAGFPRDTSVSVEDEIGVTRLRSEIQKVQQQLDNRNSALAKALAAKNKAEEIYKFRREEFRTAMQAGNASEAQRSAFEASRTALERATALVAPAQAETDLASRNLASEQQKVTAAAKRAQNIFEARSFQRNVKLFAFHFSFAAFCLGLSWVLWLRGRKARWQYQAILTALFTASVLQLLFLFLRYSWELFFENIATLAISGIGTAACILAIIAIKRWLFSPQRLAQARLSSRRCAICATPFLESQSHCWKCGQPLVEKCPSCGSNRLIFAPYCGNCGADRQTSSLEN